VSRVPVEVLWSPGCAHAEDLRRRLGEASREEGVQLDLVEREVSTPQQARALRMPGSPTVRIAGRDVEPGADRREDFGLG
jgi:hypothetical protein